MDYEVPEELDFFERGFGLSLEHDPDEAFFSYIYRYENGQDLIFTHSPFTGNSVSVKLVTGKAEIFYLYLEGVASIAFQAWEQDKIIRVYFSSKSTKELRVSYLPQPKLHYSEF